MDKNPIGEAQKSAGGIKGVKTEVLSQHDKAIYEAGKTLLIESIKTGRDFCQFMITTSAGAIPVYLAIIAFLLPRDYKLGIVMGIVAAGPAVLFLLSALIFALGYFPKGNYISLNLPSEIEEARNRIIDRRRKFATAGMIIFAIATLYTIAVFFVNISAR